MTTLEMLESISSPAVAELQGENEPSTSYMSTPDTTTLETLESTPCSAVAEVQEEIEPSKSSPANTVLQSGNEVSNNDQPSAPSPPPTNSHSVLSEESAAGPVQPVELAIIRQAYGPGLAIEDDDSSGLSSPPSSRSPVSGFGKDGDDEYGATALLSLQDQTQLPSIRAQLPGQFPIPSPPTVGRRKRRASNPVPSTTAYTNQRPKRKTTSRLSSSALDKASRPVTASPSSSQVSCSSCGKTCRDSKVLEQHMQEATVHIGNVCRWPGCSHIAPSSRALNKHITDHNTELKPQSDSNVFKCMWPNCGKTFTLAETLARHLRAHQISASQATENGTTQA
ncbi:hypothetical protein BKA67DRAFT_661343 [Truncatella angustata]|uniref:C2H2-type domain-containing protein n=1 Tax=Truncatella angustata TaxID=152316 RepID=A0A9P8UEB5_9PEZI|nr:uncharacterized protein BKA67DRAFT_661343 [Truncatella angustata]KAH6648361.1 hypothetical protein BKA67DRAFT_661343 [Truncatella angustata]KAH8204801.1 hypothetical protein TruAng_000990 [Truncatella angustata]